MIKPTKRFIIIFLLFIIQFNANAQTSKIDSLTNLISSAPDSIKIVLQLQIAQEFISRNYDSISFYSQNAYDLAKKQSNQKMMDSALNLMGKAPYLQSGNKYAHRAWNKHTAAKNEKIAEMEIRFETEKRESELEKADLKNELQEQQLLEANFQLVTILIMSVITVAFVIVYYFMRSKRIIAERMAQELQVDALKQQLIELQLKYEGIQKTIDLTHINQQLSDPLTEGEFEALQLSLEGLPNSEIADKLSIPINGIKIHLLNIYKKLKASDKKKVFNYMHNLS